MPETPDMPDIQPVTPAPTLPPDGTKVRATTIPSVEYDREAEDIEGVLHTVPSPFGPPDNCFVDGIGVEPESVVPIPDAGAADGAA